MKRLAFLVLGAALAGSVWAQTFAIRQPVEGARIRETYNIRIPARTIEGNEYIGIYVNGKFIEAVRPEVEGQDFVYPLDPRSLRDKKGLQPGHATLEAVLYQDPGENRPSQVISRTAVNVSIDNSASIVVPESGFDLKYKFSSGKELRYEMTSETSLARVSQAQALLGSRGFEVPVEREKFRFLMAIDNVYNDGDGMIRLRALPDKDRDYAFIRLASEGNAVRKVYQSEMASVYMRMSNKGREEFGAIAPYIPIEGTSGNARILDFFLRLPFPILPSKSIKPTAPDNVWQGAFSLGRSINTVTDRVTDVIPGRGTFEAVEYQNGRPCARIRTSVASGAADLRNLSNLGFNQQNQSLRLDSVAWISLATGVIVRHEITLVQEALIDNPEPVSQPGVAAGGGVRPGQGGVTPVPGNGQQGGGIQNDSIIPVYDPHKDEEGNWRVYRLQVQNGGVPPSGPPGQFRGGPGPGIPRGPGPGVPGGPGFNGPQPVQATPRAVGKQIVRVSLSAVIQLENP